MQPTIVISNIIFFFLQRSDNSIPTGSAIGHLGLVEEGHSDTSPVNVTM